MPAKIIQIGLLSFGLIAIAFGMALQPPEPPITSWLWTAFGVVLISVGTLSVLYAPTKDTIPQFMPTDRRRKLLVGKLLIVCAVAGLLYIVVAHPFPQSEGQKWWIGLVYSAALLWFLLAGIFLIVRS